MVPSPFSEEFELVGRYLLNPGAALSDIDIAQKEIFLSQLHEPDHAGQHSGFVAAHCVHGEGRLSRRALQCQAARYGLLMGT